MRMKTICQSSQRQESDVHHRFHRNNTSVQPNGTDMLSNPISPCQTANEEACRTPSQGKEAEDRFAVALTKNNQTVGHVPREQSRILWYFLSHGGKLTAEVTGRRRRSPLVQGGLEIPCTFTVKAVADPENLRG